MERANDTSMPTSPARSSEAEPTSPELPSPEELDGLRAKLLATRDEILARTRNRVTEVLESDTSVGDEIDAANHDSAQAFELRLAGKDRKLLELIEHALDKLSTGEYGLCEGTGDPIDRARLQLRPWVRYSVEYQELVEKQRDLYEE